MTLIIYHFIALFLIKKSLVDSYGLSSLETELLSLTFFKIKYHLSSNDPHQDDPDQNDPHQDDPLQNNPDRDDPHQKRRIYGKNG